ncbi:MAG: condensation domain-containing protein, partial [Archangium sp.]
MAHASVREVVAVVREDVPGDQRLVAYVVPREGHTPDAAGLRAELSRKLPEYMVPSALVVLEALPLTPNGKVDRKALPAPDASALPRKSSRPPRDELERRLVTLWAEVLRVESVGVEENFFSLGGHSLLATQLISRIHTLLGVVLPLRALFEAPTVAMLAEHLRTAPGSAAPQVPPLLPADRTGSLPLSFAQQRLWFLDRLEPGKPLYNSPLSLRLKGALEVSVLERAFTELVRRHESLRTSFQDVLGQPVQLISPPAPFHLPVVELTGLEEREAEARRLAEEEAGRPFDLARGSLLRATLLRLDDTEHVLLLTLHHIVSDGLSRGILVREMGALYEAFTAGRPSPLPELEVQYADYALWQRGWLRGEALESQLSYWREQLAGAPGVLELPTDRPRPSVPSFQGATLPVHLPRPLVESLEALSQREGVTPFMVLLAAFQLLLSRYSGQEDISVGSPIAGRRMAELEGLIGLFINTLVLRTRLEGNPTFRELLARVKQTTLGAYTHQDLPFEKLVEELQPPRIASVSPLFQVMLVLQEDQTPALAGGGLQLQVGETANGTTQFDLVLSLNRNQGLSGDIKYSTDLFEPGTIERMMGHFRVLLEGAVENPDERIGALALMRQEERQRVLEEWNA